MIKQRIDYIDRMKGFAIFLVVMGHVMGFSFGQADDVAGRWISSFHMPLFMFLSGLVASSGIVAPFWSAGKLAKKLRGLLFPLFVFGLCYTFTFFQRHHIWCDWVYGVTCQEWLLVSYDFGDVLSVALSVSAEC